MIPSIPVTSVTLMRDVTMLLLSQTISISHLLLTVLLAINPMSSSLPSVLVEMWSTIWRMVMFHQVILLLW